ncbi:VOC family protein [Flavobacteriales bacterium]|nr:VOC family protein [Flavobacteriales bacterium]
MNLNQITVPALDVPKSIAFYKKLGLTLIVHSNDNYARFICPDGNSTFSIQKSDNQNLASEIKVYFEIESLDEKVKDLIDKGIKIEELPTEKTWLWREAYLKDPSGNQIILYFAGENRINPPWKIKS